MSKNVIQKMKVAEMRKELTKRGLITTGKRRELLNRLMCNEVRRKWGIEKQIIIF